jgi:hypothetical protein
MLATAVGAELGSLAGVWCLGLVTVWLGLVGDEMGERSNVLPVLVGVLIAAFGAAE